MKKLCLMRHAKSSWKQTELADIDRPLNQRGLRDAPMMGQRLSSLGLVVDRIISSPAKRAITTARTVAGTIGYTYADIDTDDNIYLADSGSLYEIIAQLDNSINSVMLFGHNPGFTIMANDIGDASIDNMPTCSIAVFDLTIDSWSEVARGCGTLCYFDFPKNIKKA